MADKKISELPVLGYAPDSARVPVLDGSVVMAAPVSVLRNPSAHKSSHASGGADALAAADIGAVSAASIAETNAGTAEDKAVTPAGLAAFSRVVRGFFDRDVSLGAGTQIITGVGFPSRVISFVAARSTGAGAGMSIGYVDGWSQACTLFYGAYTPGSFTSAFYPVYLQTASDATIVASVSNINNDGFVLDWAVPTGSPAGTYRVNWMCWR